MEARNAWYDIHIHWSVPVQERVIQATAKLSQIVANSDEPVVVEKTGDRGARVEYLDFLSIANYLSFFDVGIAIVDKQVVAFQASTAYLATDKES